ncbi:MAG: hypothetical protein H0X07_12940, partial [Gemmatimonadales bacterium]|nr:hypothetical protein [Gemmatimonadales bacterium]
MIYRFSQYRSWGPCSAPAACPPAGVDAIAAPTLPTVAWPLDTAFDKVYPDFPGGSSVGGAANLSGVPGLFLMNGVGESA